MDTPGSAYGMAATGDKAYVADGSSGLLILPLPIEILPVTVNNDTSISFTIPAPPIAGNYILRVFNANESDEAFITFISAGTDLIPPGSITNLTGNAGSGPGKITLTWTAPGDDGRSGTAHHYKVRYSNQPVSDQTWDQAEVYSQTWTPVTGGLGEYRIISGFNPGQTCHLAIKTVDEAGNISTISNSTQVVAGSGGRQEYTAGGLTILADSIVSGGGSTYNASGNVVINDFLYFNGTLSIDDSAMTVSGTGELYMENIPLYDHLTLYNDHFVFDVDPNQMISEYINPENLALTVGGMSVGISSLTIISGGLEIEGLLHAGSLSLTSHFKITQANGIELIGGDITIGQAELGLESVDLQPDSLRIDRAILSAPGIGVVAVNNLIVNSQGISFQNGKIEFMDFTAQVADLEVTESSFTISGSMQALNAAIAINALEISNQGLTFQDASFNLSGLAVAIGSSIADDGSQDMILHGFLSLPENMGGTAVEANFILHRGGKVDLNGRIENVNVSLGSSGYSLEGGWLEFDTQQQKYYGGASLSIPRLFTIDAEMGIWAGYLNMVSVAAENINKCILYGPPPAPVPIVYMQRIGAGLDELMPGPPPIIMSGDLALTAGPQLEINGNTYYAVRGDLAIEIDTGGRLEGAGTVFIISDDGKMAEATVILEKDKGVEIIGELSILEILNVEGSMRVDNQNQLNGSLLGSLCAPQDWWLIAGDCFGNITATVENTYISMSVTKTINYLIGKKEITVTVTYSKDGFDWDLAEAQGDWSLPAYAAIRNGAGTWRVGSNLKIVGAYRGRQEEITAGALQTKTVEILELNESVPYAIFRIQWTNDEDIDITLIAPDGTIYTPADSGVDVFYRKNLAIPEAYYAVPDPQLGTWQVNVPDTPDIGEYVVQLVIPNEIPTLTITGPAGQIDTNPVDITWTAHDPDDNATVSLYYDNDNQDFNGHLIVAGLSEETVSSYHWDTIDVPNGSYFIYAKIYDGHNSPVYAYAPGQVVVDHADGPPTPQGVSIVPREDSVCFTWEFSTGAAGYRIYYGPANDMEEALEVMDVGQTNAYELTSLNSGWQYKVFLAAYNKEGVEGDTTEPTIVTLYSLYGNNIPQIVSRPVTVAKEGQLYQYQVEAVGLDGDDLTYTLISYPDGMVISEKTGTIQWMPADTDLGNTLISIEATDGKEGRDIQSFYLIVSEEWNTTPPRITSRPSGEPVALGATFTYQLEATEADGDAFQFLPVIMPQGMELDANGMISWMPSAEQTGSHQVWIQVKDEDNMSDSQLFKVIVVSFLDYDLDGIDDESDNCRMIYNPDQDDTDEDGIGDTCDTCPGVADPDQKDSDNDKIGDLCETSCTDPFDADTDDDGIPDGIEDFNRNNILDPGETYPCDIDTDDDGIQDGTELGYTTDDIGSDTDTAIFVPDPDPSTTTDPLNSDTDQDGISDGWETDNNLNPLLNDASFDADGDGYSNRREYISMTDPQNRDSTPPPITIYVDDNISSREDGSMSHPFNTIGEGIDFAGAGDTVHVAQGYYEENIILDKNISLIGEGPDLTIIDGSRQNLAAVQCIGMTDGSIKGFHIQSGVGAGIKCEESSISIQQNIISENSSHGGIEGDGIVITQGSSVTVKNNIIYGNEQNGIYLAEGTAAEIINNTICSNGRDGIYARSGDGVIIKNNIIIVNGICGISCNQTPKPTLSYNNIWNNAGLNYHDCAAGTGDISSDPLFEDPANPNYHLMPGSPCIDAGDPASDYSSEPEPNGGRINMGTYGGTAEAATNTFDSDNDGLYDYLENAGCTDTFDADTDDDGISDGTEDANKNGVVDPGETDPCSIDTDGDGIQDGTELGITEPVPDPDEEGPLLGTDTNVFIADADSDTTTDPLNKDSDDDGAWDGTEDANHNGRVDAGETDPSNPSSYPAQTTIHLKKGFNLIAIPSDVTNQPDLKDWLPVLGDSSEIEKVMVYDGQAGKFITLIPGDASNPSFMLKGGEGLIVYAKQDKEISFTSVLCSTHDLKPGFNLAGFACPEEDYSAYQILNDLGSENVSSIQRYSTEKGAFEAAGFGLEGQLVGVDFPIVQGEGYFIYMK